MGGSDPGKTDRKPLQIYRHLRSLNIQSNEAPPICRAYGYLNNKPCFEKRQLTKFSSLCCRSIAARGRQSLCALGGQESSETCMRAGGLALFLPPLDSLLDARIGREREGGIRIQNMAGNRRH